MIASLVQEIQTERPVHFFIGHPLPAIVGNMVRRRRRGGGVVEISWWWRHGSHGSSGWRWRKGRRSHPGPHHISTTVSEGNLTCARLSLRKTFLSTVVPRFKALGLSMASSALNPGSSLNPGTSLLSYMEIVSTRKVNLNKTIRIEAYLFNLPF